MFLKQYLQRIHYTGSTDISLDTLKNLHRQHLLHIPIENLDIHTGTKIHLDIDALYTKIILNRRGGFCYELNGLFYQLLTELGFKADMVSGRVYVPGQHGGFFRDEFDHIALVVNVAGTLWLADVAMGRMFALYPLQITPDLVQTDLTGSYRISSHDTQYLSVQQMNEAGSWQPAYIFSLIPRKLQDFSAMCEFQQTSPQSYFTRNKLCTIVTSGGRITLTDDKLKITDGTLIKEMPVISTEDFTKKLQEYFSIVL